jgi:hypothetical protein
MGGSSLGKHECETTGFGEGEGSRSGECSKRVADLVGDRIEGLGIVERWRRVIGRG